VTLKKKLLDAPEPDLDAPKDIFEMAIIAPQMIEKATKGGTDGAIKAVRQVLEELLETAHHRHLLRDAVLRAARRLSNEERQIFAALDDHDWETLRRKAQSLVNAFKDTKASKRDAAIRTLKGTLAELVFYRSGPFFNAFSRAARRAEDLGLDPGVVRLVRKVEASSLDKKGNIVFRELTDGLLIVQRSDGEFQILTVFEMKSRSNKGDLAQRKSDELELVEELEAGRAFVREGQIEADIERLSELDLRLDDEIVAAGEVRFSRHNTEWIGVTPKDVKLSDKQVERIKLAVSNFTPVRQSIPDDALNRVCVALLQLLADVQR